MDTRISVPDLDVKEVSKITRVCERNVLVAAQSGKLRGVRCGPGGKWRFRAEWVQAWVDSWTSGGTKYGRSKSTTDPDPTVR